MPGLDRAALDRPRKDSGRIRRSLLLAVPGCFFIALITFICYGLRLAYPTVSLCFLIIVVLQSLFGDFRSSAIVSVISFLSLNYFFIPPLFSLRVSDASDTLALAAFLVAGLVITRLTSQTREAADSEELQRREMTHLYELAQELLLLKPEVTMGTPLLKPFCVHFRMQAICVFDAATAEHYAAGDSLKHLAEKTRDAYITGQEFQDEGSRVAVRLLQASGVTTGAVGFEGLRHLESAGPLTALATITIERLRAFQQASL